MYEENSEGFQNGISISDVPGYFGCSEISFVEFQECQPHWYIYLNFFYGRNIFGQFHYQRQTMLPTDRIGLFIENSCELGLFPGTQLVYMQTTCTNFNRKETKNINTIQAYFTKVFWI